MVRRYYELPSLTSLAAFEASARHGSLKLAAAELNVTPGATSRQIKSLEDELGVSLFDRGAQGITLTPEGEDLYAVLSQGFSRASEAVRRIKTGSDVTRVTLACTNAFASMWLMPRMGDFWRRYPDISVDHLITDDVRDFRRAEIDLRVRYGAGVWPDETAHRLLDETVYPVCSPAFADERSGAVAEDIPTLPLLHVDWVDPFWTDWDELLRRAAIPHGSLPGRRFGNFVVTLQACQEDQGIAIGWHRLVAERIADGRLVAFTDLKIEAPGAYYLTWNDNRAPTPAMETLKAWLIEVASDEGGR